MKTLIKAILCLLPFAGGYTQNLVSVFPGQASQGQTLPVIFTGQNTNFQQGTSTSVWFSQGSSTMILANSVSIINGNQLSAQFSFLYNHQPGYYTANVYTPGTGFMSLPNAFLLTPGSSPPSLVTVNPGTASQGQTLSVTFTGQNTHFQQGTTTSFWFSQGSGTIITPVSLNILSNTQAQATFVFDYTHPLGYYQANSYPSQDGLLTLPDAFLLTPGANPPHLVSVSPSTAYVSQPLAITITGQNTHFMQSSNTIFFEHQWFQLYPYSVNVLSNTQLSVTLVPPYNAATGLYSTRVSNPTDGLMSLANSLNLLPNPYTPLITNVTPDSVMTGPAVTFMVYANHTHFTYSPYHTAILSGPGYAYTYNAMVINDTQLAFTFNLNTLPTGYYTFEISNEIEGTLVYQGTIYLSQLPIPAEVLQEEKLKVYPNPAVSEIMILPPDNEYITSVTVYNTLGRLVCSAAYQHVRLPRRLQIEALAPGIYYLEVMTKDRRLVEKIIKH
ncbi:MAG TPA: T9SS type A sorting domain-containing protein [Bacteroidales bacterium]|nr:T9SS type A sorting domain-containing protein [Bacteroidales bacterium]HSA43672.1 T9SS type A sorting domain-containing protein [Bacteroidales bacterium]